VFRLLQRFRALAGGEDRMQGRMRGRLPGFASKLHQ